MTVRLATAVVPSDSSYEQRTNAPHLTCALVNNMPDGAFDATERQYLGLLEEGSADNIIEVRRYTMSGVPRGEHTSSRIAREYLPLTNIYVDPPDCLIVTGSNPIEQDIRDELYWSELVELLGWSQRSVASTLLSCLSAHAALSVFDGIARVRLPDKCTGVFPQRVVLSDPLTVGLDSEIVLPHSRWNTVPMDDLAAAGYSVLVHSEETGWGVASRREGDQQLVLVQGHPEYDPSSLLREYRRDAGRYVRRERDELPYLPYHCASPEDWEGLQRTHEKIIDGERNPLLVEQYPFDEVGARAPWPWRPVALSFYANWLSSVKKRRD